MKRQLSMAALGACLGALAPAPGMAGRPLVAPTLEEALRQSGWDVRRVDGEGLRLYSPLRKAGGAGVEASVPAPQAGEAPAAGAVATQMPPGLDADTLRRVGWRIERAGDGSTLLYPPAPAPQAPAAEAAVVGADAPGGALQVPAAPAAPPVSATPAAPAAASEPAPEVPTEAVPKAAPASGTEVSLADIDALLRGRGWQVERDLQGSLVLRPRAADLAPQTITPSQGFVTAPVREETVKLPVNRWVDARAIADAWVAEHGGGRLR
ncbi:MAG TPA: hypothetical protein VLM84_05155, partial [Chromatiaceae bacterium]|nr:hypothetical protein [Chromatiaceae bacterium]